MNNIEAIKVEIGKMNLGDMERLVELLVEAAYLLGQREGLKEASEIAVSQSQMSWAEATS